MVVVRDWLETALSAGCGRIASISQADLSECLPDKGQMGVDGLCLRVTQPDFNRQPIRKRTGSQDNEVLLRLIVRAYIGDDDFIGVESGSCPVGNGRVDGLGGVVHEAIALRVGGLIKLTVIIGVWGVVVTVGVVGIEEVETAVCTTFVIVRQSLLASWQNGRFTPIIQPRHH